MSIAAGFKQSDLGVIPEDWTQSTIGSHVKGLIAGVSVNSKSAEYGGDLSVPSVLKTSAVTGGKVISAECKAIADRDLGRAKTALRANSLIISRMNTPALVGECGYAPHAVPNLYLPDRLWLAEFRQGDATSARWLAALLSSPAFAPRIKAEATGTSGTMKNIPKGPFLALAIPYPPPHEQKAIAAALGDIDELIASLDALIAKKRDVKQGAMQQLLTGKTRLPGFEGDWVTRRLATLGTFLKGSGVRRDQALSGDIPCVRYGEIYTDHHDVVRQFRSFISADVAEKATPLQTGDLLFAGSGETKEDIGKCVAFAGEHQAFAGGDIIILRPSWGIPVFLGYLMNSAHFCHQKANRGQGDAVVHISAGALGAISGLMPEPAEQAAIAEVLTAMDEEIEVLHGKKAKTVDLKGGMMQQLLAGRIRLV